MAVFWEKRNASIPIFYLSSVSIQSPCQMYYPQAKHEIGHFSWQRHLRPKGQKSCSSILSYLKGISFDLLFFRGWNISSFWKFKHVPYGSPSINWTLRRLFSSLHSAPKKWLLVFSVYVFYFSKIIIDNSFFQNILEFTFSLFNFNLCQFQ